jgi:hypothetical protein
MAAATLIPTTPGRAQGQQDENESLVQRGFEIAPVPLNLEGKNRALVGLGSYIVNAIGDCIACHSQPRRRFLPGGDPFLGFQEKINTDSYLSGGRIFRGNFPANGPPVPPDSTTQVVSRNLTPFEDGLPAGMTFPEFLTTMRTGNDYDVGSPDSDPHRLMQTMPWPVFRNMTDRDILAVYEYLRAIPPLAPPIPE